ncbi:MAG: hypothetical protein KDC12_10425 [Flavobacteriales bacterium]|nr:hypothetical protein [Flavobacteriales bacterium]
MAVLLVSLAGCDKHDVSDPVVMELRAFNGQGEETTAWVSGEGGKVVVEAADETELDMIRLRFAGLKQYEERDGLWVKTGYSTHWGASNSRVVNGTSVEESWNISIPDSLNGWYKITADALDAAGNLSEAQNLNIAVTDPSAPTINCSQLNPAPSDTAWVCTVGSSLKIKGTIESAEGLAAFRVRFLNTGFSTLQVIDYPLNSENNVVLESFTYQVPVTVGTRWLFQLEAEDIAGRITTKTIYCTASP